MTNTAKKILFLDIDGVLTTLRSRRSGGPSRFDERAVEALTRLLLSARTDVIIHSSWRKLPEPPPGQWTFPPPSWWWFWDFNWFKELCRHQNCAALADCIRDEAPFTISSNRGQEIALWLNENHQEGNKYVVLDDEVNTIRDSLADRNDVLIVKTDDESGLTTEHVDVALSWLNG